MGALATPTHDHATGADRGAAALRVVAGEPGLRGAVWAALEQVEDPELPLSVTDLGLVRRLEVDGGRVRIGLTYTSLACPCVDMIRDETCEVVGAVDGVVHVEVEDVYEVWSRDDVTPEGIDVLRAVAVL